MSATSERRHRRTLPANVELLLWAAEQLSISKSTSYRLVKAGEIPGVFQVGAQYRVSVVRFRRAIHVRTPTLDTLTAHRTNNA